MGLEVELSSMDVQVVTGAGYRTSWRGQGKAASGEVSRGQSSSLLLRGAGSGISQTLDDQGLLGLVTPMLCGKGAACLLPAAQSELGGRQAWVQLSGKEQDRGSQRCLSFAAVRKALGSRLQLKERLVPLAGVSPGKWQWQERRDHIARQGVDGSLCPPSTRVRP